MHFKSTYEMWENINQFQEGDDKVKQAKLQNFRMRFERLKMNENESIVECFLRVDEVVNMIRGLGEEFKEEMIVQKLLRSLPMRLNAKISIIEEMANLKDLKVDQRNGTLTAYEMRVGKEKYEVKEVTLRLYSEGKEHKVHQDCSNIESNQELAQLARNLKSGSGKYKGKFPFKCFNYGRVRHFSSKFPYKEKDEREEDIKFRNKSQTYQKKNPTKRRCSIAQQQNQTMKTHRKMSKISIFLWPLK